MVGNVQKTLVAKVGILEYDSSLTPSLTPVQKKYGDNAQRNFEIKKKSLRGSPNSASECSDIKFRTNSNGG